MKRTSLVPLLILIPFTALTALAVHHEGYLGFIPVHTSSVWGYQVIADLVIALALFLSFMIPDARRRGLSPWPFVALTLVLGSIGPLTYMVVRGLKDPARAA